MTAGLPSIFHLKHLTLGLLLAHRLLSPLNEILKFITGDALSNDRASRIMKELLKENVYYPQIMGRLLATKKVLHIFRWAPVTLAWLKLST